jgi:tRNA pseudouridine55 synthase
VTRLNKSSSQNPPPLGGVLVLDKPAGITSMRAVEIVRRRAGGVKTGHAGTLDPLATGVLVLALGRATRVIDRLMATDKRYHTIIDLTAFTTTDDREGDRMEVSIAEPPSEDDIRTALGRFVGEIQQRPPAFSAVKIDGRRAYKLARGGTPADIRARPVVVHAVELLSYRWPLVELAMHCEKGVYVRSLARDLGEALGTGGHCASIRRTAVGPFTVDMAIAPERLPDPLRAEHLLPVETTLAMLGDDR